MMDTTLKTLLEVLEGYLEVKVSSKYPPLKLDFYGASASNIKVAFDYNRELVDFIKSIPGRSYVPSQKVWKIPIAALRTLEKEAARRGIPVKLSQRLAEWQSKSDKARLKLVSLKNSPAPEIPDITFRCKTHLRDYQRFGVYYAYITLGVFKGLLLADDMGLGKTLQSLAVADLLLQKKPDARILVLCPASLKYTWNAEIEKHYPDFTKVVIDGNKNRRSSLWKEDVNFYIANYELLLHDNEPFTVYWDLVIADEVTYLKNYKAQRTKKAKALRRVYTLGLSGIPIENSISDLHSIMDFVIPGALGPYWYFIETYCKRDYWGNIVGIKNIQELRERIEPYYLRRTKSQVLKELPPKIYNNHVFYMSKIEYDIYDAIRLQILEEIEDMIEDENKLTLSTVLTKLLRLKQAVLDPNLVGVEYNELSTKTKSLLEILEMSEGHQVVIFTQFAEYSRTLKEILGSDALLLEGAVSPKERQELIEKFQSGKARYFVSTDAGAYGVTLTAADIVVHMDLPWTPAKMRQREDRLHRIGQDNVVNVVIMTAEDTIDRYIQSVLHSKYDIIKSTLGEEEDLEQLASVITKEDILQALERGAV